MVWMWRGWVAAEACGCTNVVKREDGLMSEERVRKMAMMGIQNQTEMSMEYMRPMR